MANTVKNVSKEQLTVEFKTGRTMTIVLELDDQVKTNGSEVIIADQKGVILNHLYNIRWAKRERMSIWYAE